MKRVGVRVALAAAAALVAAPGIAEEGQPQDCSFFKGQRLVTVGGHEDRTPVIPLFADIVTFDLWRDGAFTPGTDFRTKRVFVSILETARKTGRLSSRPNF
jgi:hypothetical protein